MKITYIIYSHQNKAVKIGYASDLASRISALQISTPEKLSLIFAFEGGKETEKTLHTLLHKYRLRGEWFVYNEEVLSVLLNYQKTCVDALTFTPKTDQVLSYKILSIAEDYLSHQTTKARVRIGLSYLRKVCKGVNISSIKSIMHNAGYITKTDKSNKVYFYKK